MQLSSTQHDRALGAVIASAVGDALGAPFEFGGPYETTEAITMRGGGMWAPGEWTDDTAMTIPIIQALAQSQDLMSADTQSQIVKAWIGWAAEAKDVGIQISKVLSRTRVELKEYPSTIPAEVALRQAHALHQAANQSGGNGSLMRLAPIPLAYPAPEDAPRLTGAVRAISDLTHYESDTGDACVLWAQAIAHAIRTGELDVRIGFEQIPSDRRGRWLKLIDEAETRYPRDFDRNGWVVQAFQGAWSAIHHTKDADGIEDAPSHLERALLAAVRGGRDADTVAAIAGGLVGAAYGVLAIPTAWREPLHGWPDSGDGAMRGDDLETLAEKIIDTTGPVQR